MSVFLNSILQLLEFGWQHPVYTLLGIAAVLLLLFLFIKTFKCPTDVCKIDVKDGDKRIRMKKVCRR